MTNSKILIAPSVLAADFSKMRDEIRKIEAAGGDIIHLDVMDGQFVPDISFGHKMVADIRKLTALPLDVHLMTETPENQAASFAGAGADSITFHPEAVVHAQRLVTHIKSLGKKAGVSIVPSTPAFMLQELVPFVDHILIMTVNPGYGGQKMIPECLEKVRYLSGLKNEKGYSFSLAVDGGINLATAALARDAGAEILVMGSAFFEAADPQGVIAAARGTKDISNFTCKKLS
jgi:ribulose-phosphate 3-epimerase